MSAAKNRWMTLVMLLLAGCNYFHKAGSDDDADVADLDDTEPRLELKNPAKPEMIKEAAPEEAQLELKLRVGDQFPLTKRIEQRLTQNDSGGPSVSQSMTELVLSLVVDKLQPDGSKLMSVRYHRVKYMQDIRGKRIVYSSDHQGEAVPSEALLYSGLANNGFSFWLGPNNKVVELVGFNEFLKSCLRNVPAQNAAAVQQQLESMKSGEGIANFIDDSIGLLPYHSGPNRSAVAVKEGSFWDLEPRASETPIPLLTTTRCLLKELTPQSAEIVLDGDISGPPKGAVIRSPEGNLRVFVNSGHSTGFCHVDRKSGLPTKSQVLRHLELTMEMPNGQKIQQSKDTVSTITSYLDQSQFSAKSSNRRVQQASFQNALGTENHRQVIRAGGAVQDQ